jgi:hypothetical protein
MDQNEDDVWEVDPLFKCSLRQTASAERSGIEQHVRSQCRVLNGLGMDFVISIKGDQIPLYVSVLYVLNGPAGGR